MDRDESQEPFCSIPGGRKLPPSSVMRSRSGVAPVGRTDIALPHTGVFNLAAPTSKPRPCGFQPDEAEC
eukprot:3624888-Pyramimonas_sp.AAC.1